MSDVLQVNTKATKRNREQTKRVCELKGWGCNPNASALSPRPYAYKIVGWDKMTPPEEVELPNGSFTLDQVVGMLEAEGVIWGYWSMPHGDREIDQTIRRFTSFWKGGAYSVTEIWGWLVHGDKLLVETRDPFDLTAAMDALEMIYTRKEK